MMKVRCISLWQPWASLMACGPKWIETRSWNTAVRGVVMIHAAKTRKGLRLVREGDRRIRKAMEDVLGGPVAEWDDWLPRGVILAGGQLVDTMPTAEAVKCHPDQEPFGDFRPGRYAHLYATVWAIEPIPWKGAQGFFWAEVPDEVVAEAGPGTVE